MVWIKTGDSLINLSLVKVISINLLKGIKIDDIHIDVSLKDLSYFLDGITKIIKEEPPDYAVYDMSEIIELGRIIRRCSMVTVAYDLDGVISRTPVRFYGLLKRCKPLLYLSSLLCPVKMRPNGHCVIITGRSIKDKKITEIWLKLHGIIGDVYYNPNGYSKESAIEHKAKTINELGIELYYEDEWDVAKELQRRCPQCEIRIV